MVCEDDPRRIKGVIVMFRKISRFSPNRFVVGFIVGAMLFSGSAFAYKSYVSENTP